MRKTDIDKESWKKTVKSINFDNAVLEAIKARAKKEDTQVSFLVNAICRKIFLNDRAFYRELAKHHYRLFQEYKYLSENFVEEEP